MRCSQPGGGSESASIRANTSPVAASKPVAAAAGMPHNGSNTTLAPAASATSAVWSLLALSTTTISSAGRLCRSSAAKQARRCSASSRAGMITEIRIMAGAYVDRSTDVDRLTNLSNCKDGVMATTPPALGLLLDVDGPIASPVTRRVPDAIIRDLVVLAAAGIPIAFITGRSLPFLRDHVVAELVEHGLADDARMYGVCEKGAVWFSISSRGLGVSETDDTVAIPTAVVHDIRSLVTRNYADTMFFDETKQAMISIEQRQDVTNGDYRIAQAEFNRAAFTLCADHGLGVSYDDQEVPDAAGRVPYRIESTIISTDIESVTLDKDRAAERALDFFAGSGPLPTLWRSVGDSRSDYLMADHVHSAGHDVAHIDVRPSDGMLERPYPVIAMGDLIHDDAGAAFLGYWVDKLGLR